MTISYIREVQPREGEGVTDADIAAAINADASRYSDQPLTVSQIASRLSAAGHDGAGITARVMEAMDGVAQTNRLVKNKVLIADQGGTIALGNLLQRTMFQQFVAGGLLQEADVTALLSLATVPATVTAQDVIDSRTVYEAAQAKLALADQYSTVHSAHIVPVLDGDNKTTADLAAALRAAGDALGAL